MYYECGWFFKKEEIFLKFCYFSRLLVTLIVCNPVTGIITVFCVGWPPAYTNRLCELLVMTVKDNYRNRCFNE